MDEEISSDSSQSAKIDLSRLRKVLIIGLPLLLVVILVFLWKANSWKSISPDDHFRFKMPDMGEKVDGGNIFHVDDNYYGETLEIGGKEIQGWITYTAWALKQPFGAEVYMVGYNDIPAGALRVLSDKQILDEVMSGAHLVIGVANEAESQKLEHRLPAVEASFEVKALNGSRFDVSKRVYLEREHGRAYIVIFAIRMLSDEGISQADAMEKFFGSFEILD